jgi:predicted CxxxxCH...CXXCH cytochrome family protein
VVGLLAVPAAALDPPHDVSNIIDCASCHAGHGGDLLPRYAAQEAMCQSCHNPLGQAATMPDVANHVVDGGLTIVDCGSCHDPHGPHQSTDPHTSITADNLSLVRVDPVIYVPAAVGPLVFQQRPQHFAFAEADPPWLGPCQVCHTSTNHHTQDNTADHDHNVGLDCVSCHQHIDGFLPTAGCNVCHGNVTNAAPPVDTNGFSDTTLVTVGAHQSHMVTGTTRLAIACDECHIVPGSAADPGHIEVPPAEVTFGPLATTGSLTPDWNVSSPNLCTNTYCHGASIGGGTNKTPDWTNTGGGEADCGTCHGTPPPSPHMQQLTCNPCHPDTVTVAETIDVPGGFHINGTVDLGPMACNQCHGSVTNDAPPVDTNGNSDTTMVTVGAHQSHMQDGTLRQAINCNECHTVPGAWDDAGHIDASPAEINFGPLATTGALTPDWDVSSPDLCTNTYCHGASLAGGTNKTPDWTNTGGGETACGTCHGDPPPTPHPQQGACNPCHPQTVTPAEVVDVAGGFHINGTIEASTTGACDSCHGAPPATGAHVLHFGALPADASYGGTGATIDVLPAGTAYAFDCGNCHPLNAANHGNGVPNAGGGAAEIDVSPVGAPPASMKAMNPGSASYTPGGSTFTDAEGFEYTIGTCSDVYCHSQLDVGVPGPVPEPGIDFPFTGYPMTYPPYTVNYSRTYTSPVWDDSLSCDGCHGFPPRTAAAVQGGQVEAGAGDTHSWIDDAGYEDLHGWNMSFDPLACATCHFDTVIDQGVRARDINDWSVYTPVPIDDYAVHVNGAPDVAFTTDLILYATSGGDVWYDVSGSSWNGGAETCTNVPCHINDTPVTWGTPYRWENMYECNVCHQM